MKWTVLPTVAFGLVVSACADIGSEDILTSGICATVTASNDDNNKLIVEAELTAGCGLSASYVVLSNDDSLDTSYLSQSYTLNQHTNILNATNYTASTNLDYQAGAPVTVALSRPNGYVDALNSYVILPPTFTMSSPNNGDSFNLSQTMTVDWTGTTSERINFELNCIKDSGGDLQAYISEPVSSVPYDIPITRLDGYINDPTDTSYHVSSCTGTISVVRSQSGSVDSALDSGSRIYGKYQVSRNISLAF